MKDLKSVNNSAIYSVIKGFCEPIMHMAKQTISDPFFGLRMALGYSVCMTAI